jgi:hypothetical protein
MLSLTITENSSMNGATNKSHTPIEEVRLRCLSSTSGMENSHTICMKCKSLAPLQKNMASKHDKVRQRNGVHRDIVS